MGDIPVPYGANSSSGPRFIDGEQALLTNDLVGGNTQIFRYDLGTAQLEQLTFDSGDKIDAFIFTAPDFGGSRLLFCTVNDTILRLYKEVAGTFAPQYDIQLPNPAYQYYFSAEPFVFKNKSYLFVCAANDKFIPGSQNSSLPADVWLVGLEQTNPLFRKVSDERVALRLDPEVFVTPTEAYIYYYEYKENGNVHPVALHKCSTGLGENPLSNLPDFGAKKNMVVSPNPFRDRINLFNLKGNERFELTNTFGQVMYSGNNLAETDFSKLPSGVYFLFTIFSNTNASQTLKLIKQ